MIEENNKSKANSTKPTKARRTTTSKVGVKKENTTKRLKEDTKEKLRKSKGEEIVIENVKEEKKAPARRVKKAETAHAKSKLKVIPLGGLNEIGKNLTVFEYEDEIIVVDCGLAFPEDEMLGVDIVIPDISYLEKNKDKVKALLITHGHEDHIGAVPYFLKKINCPVYGSKLSLGLINVKLQEHNLENSTKLVTIEPRKVLKFGKYFKVEFIRVTHSIADSMAIAITTPVGTVLHTGDFKVDYTPIDGGYMDLQRIAELGQQGVTLLLSDSTNVLRPGHTMSEKSVGKELERLFTNCNKRIIVATFASNVHRMQQIVNAAARFKRKVAVLGRSMVNVLGLSQELGYLDGPEDTIIDIDKINLYNPEQLVILCTGSQGEPMAALSRMSMGEHKKVQVTPDDMIIFSSSAIPGNEKSIGRVVDELEKLGAEVINNQIADVHV